MTRAPAGRRRGVYAIALALLFSAILGTAALALDLAWVQLAALQTQTAADAGAHAAAVSLRAGDDLQTARRVATAVMERHAVAGEAVTVDPWQDVVFGRWDFEARRFDPTSADVNAVDVQVRRTAGGPDGSVALLIGALGDRLPVRPRPATAAVLPRDVVVVVDVSTAWDAAIPARALAELRPGRGDRVALIAYADVPVVIAPLGSALPALDVSEPAPGRDPGAALDLATTLFDDGDAARHVLLILAGSPDGAHRSRRALALSAADAADAADAAGVTVSVVAWQPDGRGLAASLVTRDGRYVEAREPAHLQLTEALARAPVAIVR